MEVLIRTCTSLPLSPRGPTLRCPDCRTPKSLELGGPQALCHPRVDRSRQCQGAGLGAGLTAMPPLKPAWCPLSGEEGVPAAPTAAGGGHAPAGPTPTCAGGRAPGGHHGAATCEGPGHRAGKECKQRLGCWGPCSALCYVVLAGMRGWRIPF